MLDEMWKRIATKIIIFNIWSWIICTNYEQQNFFSLHGVTQLVHTDMLYGIRLRQKHIQQFNWRNTSGNSIHVKLGMVHELRLRRWRMYFDTSRKKLKRNI